MILGLGLIASAAITLCRPVAGAEQLWAADTRWVIVGEQHGTAETPDIFTDLACLAANAGRTVVVALEYLAVDQIKIDAFLASDGGAAARAALLTMTNWGPQFHDGRSSLAMLAMLDRLRKMKQDGRISGVVAFVPPTYGGSGPYNAAMADRLQRIAGPPAVLVLTLVGNVHAMKMAHQFGKTKFLPAAALMPRAQTVSLNSVGNGGTAWNCQAVCGPHPNGVTRSAARGVVPMAAGDPYAGPYAGKFDAVLELGVPTTASPPARP